MVCEWDIYYKAKDGRCDESTNIRLKFRNQYNTDMYWNFCKKHVGEFLLTIAEEPVVPFTIEVWKDLESMKWQ